MNNNKLLRWAVFAFVLVLSVGFVSAIVTDDVNTQIYYSFDDDDLTSGNPDDLTPNGNNGTTVGGTTGQTGILGEAFEFDGTTNEYVKVDNIITGYPFTVNIWVFADGTDTDGAPVSLSDVSASTTYYDLRVLLDGGSSFLTCGIVRRNTASKIFRGSTQINDSWHMCTVVFNSAANATLYIDGSFDSTDTESVTFAAGTDEITIGRNSRSPPTSFYNGLVDEFSIWNKSLNTSEIQFLYNSGSPTIGQQYNFPSEDITSDPSFISPTPANDSTNNTQATINVSCSDGDVFLWFNGSIVIDNQSSPTSYTTNLSTSGVFEYDAACYNTSLSGFSNNVSRTWTYDVVYPAITLNSNNAFNINNYSQITQYDDSFFFNLTFTDNIDLYAYGVNITKNVVTILYNETNESISGTEYNYTKTLNTSSWVDGWYDIEIQVADSHTSEEINDYMVTKKKSSITFKTENDNNIKIETSESSDIEATRYIDRYSFNVDFDNPVTKSRTFHIKSDKCPLTYREKSGYAAHFVSFCDFSGNWIDFEGLGSDYTVNKFDDYHWTVTFDSVPKEVTFNSIGGLNVLTANHRWYKGVATKTAEAAGINESTEISLSLTRDPSQDNFSAFLVYNGTTYTNPTKTDDGNDVAWNQTLLSGSVEGLIPYHWNVTYNQTDSTTINFIINGSQTVFDWGVFNCSSGNISLVLNIFDENYPSIPRNATVDLEILSWITNPDNYHSFETKLENDSSYNICLYPANETLQTNFYAQYTTETGFTHRYILYNYSISNTSQNISMYNTNTTSGYSELVITARNTQNYAYFENVVAKLQRRYVDEGVWRSIQMDESGDFGTIIFHILEQTTDYKIIYYDTDNNLLKETETLKFSCTDLKCELTQLLDEAAAVSVGENISVSSSLNNITNILTVVWVDPEANNNKVEVRVTKQTLTGELIICDVFQTGSSGSVDCNVTGYAGDILLTVLTSQSPYTPIISEWIALERVALFTQMSVEEQSFWTAGVMITTIGFGLWSPAAALIAGVFGLILVLFLGIFKPVTITFIIIAAAMGVAAGLKLRR